MDLSHSCCRRFHQGVFPFASSFEKCLAFLLPLCSLVLGSYLQYSRIDLSLEKHFYDPELASWPLRDLWLTQTCLHIYAQNAVKLFACLLLLLILALTFMKKYPRLRNVLACGFLAMALGPLLVGLLKDNIAMYCPWDIEVFGGTRPYLSLAESLGSGLPAGHGFPAAHAAAGFTFVALYFTGALLGSGWRFLPLGFGLGLGLLFGLVQQMRGAHFLSHDLFSLAICWSGALLVHVLFFRKHMLAFYFEGSGVSPAAVAGSK